MTDDYLLQLARLLKASGYCFTSVTPATHERVNARLQHAWARNLTDVFGWSRPFHQGGLTPELFETMRQAEVLQPHADGWISQVRASTLGGQLFLHSAYPTTAPDAIFFGPDSYRFATAIDCYLSGSEAGNLRIQRAVDIGCGAGPGAVVVALARPQAEVFAVDINELALRYTTVNAQLAGAKGVVVQRSDLLDGIDGNFDLIVANPPYLLDAQQRTYRHGGGSFGEELSVKIAALAKKRLAPGGTLLLYTGSAIIDGSDPLLAAVTPLLGDTSLQWHYQELDPDVFGEELAKPAYGDVDRIAVVLLIVRKARA